METGADNIRFEKSSGASESRSNPWIETMIGHAAAHGSGAEAQQGCPYPCPICSAIGAFKQMNPDVKAHLAAAGREIMMAAMALVNSVTEASGSPADTRSDKIPFD